MGLFFYVPILFIFLWLGWELVEPCVGSVKLWAFSFHFIFLLLRQHCFIRGPLSSFTNSCSSSMCLCFLWRGGFLWVMQVSSWCLSTFLISLKEKLINKLKINLISRKLWLIITNLTNLIFISHLIYLLISFIDNKKNIIMYGKEDIKFEDVYKKCIESICKKNIRI